MMAATRFISLLEIMKIIDPALYLRAMEYVSVTTYRTVNESGPLTDFEKEYATRLLPHIAQLCDKADLTLFAILEPRRDPWQIADDEFDRVMAVNVRGIYACSAAVVPLMERNHWGRIINIASGLAFKGAPALMHYAASKAAVVNLTRSMAEVLGEKGINVNALAPRRNCERDGACTASEYSRNVGTNRSAADS
jgi:NAD(P)-dependent dehydrogenase (short-subunit alcohol dehydrogenase family)